MSIFFLDHRVKAFAFDLDGTLVNSLQDLTESANIMRQSLNLAPLSNVQIEAHIGDGITRLVHRAITNQTDGIVDLAIFEQGLAVFLEYYAAHLSQHTDVYEGVREGLEYLQSERLPMVVITNKSESFAHAILEDLGLSQYFSLVLGGESLPEKKPHALPLQHACEYLHIAPNALAMVGDSRNDILAARNAGSIAIGVSYGFEDIRHLGADLIIDSLLDLSTYLSRKDLV